MTPTVLAAAYLGLMPLAWWPALPMNIHLADLLFPVLALMVLHRYRGTWRMRPLDYCVMAYALSLVPSLYISDDLRSTGVELLKSGYGIAVYAVFAMYFKAEGYGTAFKVIVWATVVYCASGIAAMFLFYSSDVLLRPMGIVSALPYFGTVVRIRAGAETPGMFANYLVFALPFLWAAGPAGLLTRRQWLASLCVTLVAMAFTVSHALTGLIAAGFMIAWPHLRALPRASLRLAAVTAGILFILIVNVMLMWDIHRVEWDHDRDTSVSTPAHNYGFQGGEGAERLNLHISYTPLSSYYSLKKVALSAFLESSWTGVGLGRFEIATTRGFEQGFIDESYRYSDPHSTMFGALAETGLLGGLAILLLVVVACASSQGVAHTSEEWFRIAGRAAIFGLAISSLNVDMMNFRFLWVGLAGLRV